MRSKPRCKRSREDVDVVIVEIGGTVGDIESLPFLEAIRQMRQELGRDNAIFIHVTLVPWMPRPVNSRPSRRNTSVKELLKHRNTARHPALPHRPFSFQGAENEDRALLQRGR